MDILGEYERQNLDAPTQTRRAVPYSQQYGFFIRLVMRLSGGRITDARQATYVLLGVAGVIFLISLFLLAGLLALFLSWRGICPQGACLIPKPSNNPAPQAVCPLRLESYSKWL